MRAPAFRWRWLVPSLVVIVALALVAWLTAVDGAGVPFVYTLF